MLLNILNDIKVCNLKATFVYFCYCNKTPKIWPISASIFATIFAPYLATSNLGLGSLTSLKHGLYKANHKCLQTYKWPGTCDKLLMAPEGI